jgi:hypothetical protein
VDFFERIRGEGWDFRGWLFGVEGGEESGLGELGGEEVRRIEGEEFGEEGVGVEVRGGNEGRGVEGGEEAVGGERIKIHCALVGGQIKKIYSLY